MGHKAMESTQKEQQAGMGKWWVNWMTSVYSRILWAPSSPWQLELNWWEARSCSYSPVSFSNILDPLRNKVPRTVAIPCIGAFLMFSIVCFFSTSPFFLYLSFLSSLSTARSQRSTKPKSLLTQWESEYSGRQQYLPENLESWSEDKELGWEERRQSIDKD